MTDTEDLDKEITESENKQEEKSTDEIPKEERTEILDEFQITKTEQDKLLESEEWS